MLRILQLAIFSVIITNIILINEIPPQYEGQMFPSKYLGTDPILPTVSDLDHYMKHLKRSIKYFGMYPNNTDGNTAISLYLTKSVLKRTLLDQSDKLQAHHLKDLRQAIYDVDYILSHYIYNIAGYGWSDVEFRVSKLFQYDTSLINSIGKFNKKRLLRWIVNEDTVHDFIKEIDETTLPKKKYAELIDCGRKGYYIHIIDSDMCISRVAYIPEPINVSTSRPCAWDAFCYHRLVSGPSIGYTLSHRLLNMIIRLNTRRCYLMSEADDLALMDQLCASMYREVVYIARRGFFARDLFLEHIALCAIMGYEEFFRQHWFYKASSWMNDFDCIKEFRNFDLNRTSLLLDDIGTDASRRSYLLKWRCSSAHSLCDDHPSALLMIVMSHGIRHAAHFMTPS